MSIQFTEANALRKTKKKGLDFDSINEKLAHAQFVYRLKYDILANYKHFNMIKSKLSANPVFLDRKLYELLQHNQMSTQLACYKNFNSSC